MGESPAEIMGISGKEIEELDTLFTEILEESPGGADVLDRLKEGEKKTNVQSEKYWFCAGFLVGKFFEAAEREDLGGNTPQKGGH